MTSLYRPLPVVQERETARCFLCRGFHVFGCGITSVHYPEAMYIMPTKRSVNPDGRCEHFLPNGLGRALTRLGMRETYLDHAP